MMTEQAISVEPSGLPIDFDNRGETCKGQRSGSSDRADSSLFRYCTWSEWQEPSPCDDNNLIKLPTDADKLIATLSESLGIPIATVRTYKLSSLGRLSTLHQGYASHDASGLSSLLHRASEANKN